MTCDCVVVGAGAAGLSLALHLADSSLDSRSVLLIDKDFTLAGAHAWGFWTDQPTRYDSIVRRVWRRLRFVSRRSVCCLEAHNYHYALLYGSDLRDYARRRLTARPGIEFVEGSVERIEECGDVATAVLEDGRTYAGRWVFDSRPNPDAPRQGASSRLWQSFLGWEIEAQSAALEADIPTLMDFRTPQNQSVEFVYVLPLGDHRALVEHVTCGGRRPSRPEQETGLAEYLEQVVRVPRFRVLRSERGATSLALGPFQRKVGARVMTIGVPGGRVKPSTGYAFMRIQRDSAAIVRSLQQTGHPFGVPPDSRRHRRYDAALLGLMRYQPCEVEGLFARLFARNPLDRILRFLDEATSLHDEFVLASTLPTSFTLRALLPDRTRQRSA
jgi:lycopene beta-cyclase